ncbi:MAG: substrate-binding domain-containing protein [Acidimicrobiales bacterium]
MQKLMRRRRRIVAGGVLSGAILATMAIAGPAGASTTPAANNVILGSGSSTTYNMMQALDTLFNDSLGCYMTQPSGTNQTLDFSCASNNEGNQVGEGYTENPINDVAAEEPALGSSAGIDQIEFGGTGNDGGGTAEPTAVVNYARSSRQFKTSDYPGLNFVAYATDGVSWFTMPKVNGKTSASSGVTNLTTTQLTDIWNGTDTKWNQVGGTSTSGICVYVAQLSSGTESTWATALGFSSPTTLNAYVNSITSTSKPAGCKIPTGETYGESHTIFENEGQSIVNVGDEGNAIFFFSYGKYQVECNKPKTAQCADNKPNTTTLLGAINGITPTAADILCGTGCSAQFPVTRDLFNVYSNGSFNSTVNAQYGFPAATAATINYVSEIGFLCKPQTDVSNKDVDNPSTGDWYHTDIANTISAQGFIPFPLQTAGQDINTVDTPASAVLAADGDTTYSPDDPITGSTTAANEAISNPEGYCQVWTTDGNTAP